MGAKPLFSDKERMMIIDEYLMGKSSGMVAKKYNCAASYVRSLAFFYVHRLNKKQQNLYRNGFIHLRDLAKDGSQKKGTIVQRRRQAKYA